MFNDPDFILFMCTFLWLNVPEDSDAPYDALCRLYHHYLTDEQWHELEATFNI
jgi:hypothetical protein